VPAHQLPAWRYTEEGLAIKLDGRIDPVPVPAPVNVWLVGPGGLGTSVDPAGDLLELEARLHSDIARLLIKIRKAETAVHYARGMKVPPTRLWALWGAHRRRRAAATALRTSLHRHSGESDLLDEVRHVQQTLRRFVIELDVPTGPLARAAAGWQRSPAVPPGVILFEAENNFLTVDQRRADTHRGYAMVAGPTFGEQWRRDGDDQTDVPHEHSGTWVLGYIPRSREIYASRRSGYLTQQVWVLNDGVEQDRAHELLTELEPRMREPNSLILAANTVHAARLSRSRADRDLPIPQSRDSTTPTATTLPHS